MIKNLLALLLALQKATLDADQCSLLAQLGNKLEAISRKSPAPEADWKSVQAKINQLLEENSTLAEQYQQFSAQLLTWTDEALRTLLPSPEIIQQLEPQRPVTLGHPPGKLVAPKDEPPNIADKVDDTLYKMVAHILRAENPAETSQTLLPADKLNKKE